MTPPALILQHGSWGPPGLLGAWADERGVAVEVHHVGPAAFPEAHGRPFVAVLGSPYKPGDPEVDDELRFLAQVVAAEVPVLGLCFGGQALASVLGAKVQPATHPELGWHEITSTAPEIVPPGPWLQWHYDSFTLAPGAEQLATSGAGLQAFAHGRHLGVQFHPESTIEIVTDWARQDAARLLPLGIADGPALLEEGRRHADAAARAAFRLFDAFWRRAHR